MDKVVDAAEQRSVSFQDFRSAFREVALFLGRPSSDAVLFSDVPFDDLHPSAEDVGRLSERIGLRVESHSRKRLALSNVEFPALVLFSDGTAAPLLEADGQGHLLTSTTGDGWITPQQVLQRDIAQIYSFSVTYLNEETPGQGISGNIERPHWLTSTLTPFWRSYTQIGVAALFINLLALASPLFIMNVYDRVLPNEAIPTLWVLALGVGGAVLFDFLLKSVRAALIDHAGRRADLKLSYQLFEKVLHSTLASRPHSTGEYANRVTQYEFVREFFTSNTLSTIIDSAFVFLFVAAIYLISGWLAIFPAIAFVLVLIIGMTAQSRIGKRVATAANEAAQRQSLLVETISTIETVKSLRSERTLLRRWSELAKNASRTNEKVKQLSSWAANMTQFVQQLVSVSIVVGGAYRFANGDISSGAIIATVMLSSRAVAPFGQIALTLARMRQAMLSLQILNSIMSQPEDRPDATGFVNRDIQTGSIEFEATDFCYPESDYQVLKGFSLKISAGERVGIIGKIGSGKTTIGRLLAALYPPTGGHLFIDGVDVRQYHPSVIRGAVAFASQGADLFSGSIKDNLRLAQPGATDEDIVRVSRLTGVDDIVSHHPRGYDMPVGERGSQLSGGQRQAVALARLLLTDPKIVFLDEPSGAMDLASERELIAKLKGAFDPSVTFIVATHRHSMLELVDRLVVLDRGRVVADGPKAKVIEQLQKRARGV